MDAGHCWGPGRRRPVLVQLRTIVLHSQNFLPCHLGLLCLLLYSLFPVNLCISFLVYALVSVMHILR